MQKMSLFAGINDLSFDIWHGVYIQQILHEKN